MNSVRTSQNKTDNVNSIFDKHIFKNKLLKYAFHEASMELHILQVPADGVSRQTNKIRYYDKFYSLNALTKFKNIKVFFIMSSMAKFFKLLWLPPRYT